MASIANIGDLFDQYDAGVLTSFQLFVALHDAQPDAVQLLSIRNAAADVTQSTDGIYFTSDFDMAGLLQQVDGKKAMHEDVWVHSVNSIRAELELERAGSQTTVAPKYMMVTDDVITIPKDPYAKVDFTKPGQHITLHRIVALRDIPEHGIMRGQTGGHIQSEANLSHEGSSWVARTAIVSGNAIVSENAIVGFMSRVMGDAHVKGNAKIENFSTVSENAVIKGDAVIANEAHIKGDATVDGTAKFAPGTVVREGTLTGS